MKKIDNQISNNIECLRFSLIIGVVLIHMGVNYSNNIMSSNDINIYKLIIHLFSYVIFSSAVPLFFLISAYLFFYNYDGSKDSYFKKLKARIKTLLIPYLFFNVSYLIFKFVVQINPFLSSKLGGDSKRILDYDALDYLNSIFGFSTYPISYQFWFVRDLIIMVIFAPLFWSALKKNSWLVLFILLINWIFNPYRLINIDNVSWVFFAIGCMLAQNKFQYFNALGNRRYLIVSYIFFAMLLSLVSVSGYEYQFIDKLIFLLGVVVIWISGDLIFKNNKVRDFLVYMSGYSFFIFAVHEPILGIIAKTINKLSFFQSNVASFISYFLLPAFVILLSWIAAMIIEKCSPKFYSLVTGGR